MTAHMGIRETGAKVGFAADADRYIKPAVESRSGRHIPEYRWPALEIGRRITLRHPGSARWEEFMGKVARGIGRRNDVEVVPTRRLLVPYISGEEMESILDAKNLKESREQNPKNRLRYVGKLQKDITGLIHQEIGFQREAEMLALVGENIDADEGIVEQVDIRRWEKSIFTIDGHPTTASLTQAALRVHDPDEIMFGERQKIFNMLGSWGLQSSQLARMQSSEWEPQMVFYETALPLHQMPKYAPPGIPGEVTLGAPSVHMRAA
jgi:hypothetical protein